MILLLILLIFYCKTTLPLQLKVLDFFYLHAVLMAFEEHWLHLGSRQESDLCQSRKECKVKMININPMSPSENHIRKMEIKVFSDSYKHHLEKMLVLVCANQIINKL